MIERISATVIVLAYNQAHYVKYAIDSALNQTFRPLEVIFSDDSSEDGTYTLMEEAARNYRGDINIKLNRNARNLGVSAHFSRAVALASNDVVVYMPGDDISASDRVAASVAPFTDPSVTMVEVKHQNFYAGENPSTFSSGDSLLSTPAPFVFGINEYLDATAPPLSSCARSLRRHSFTEFPTLAEECPSDDTPTILRSLMTGRAAVIPSVKVFRRLHNSNISGPEGMKHMDFQALRLQYHADIQWARRTGLCDPHTLNRIEAWVENTIRRRELRRLVDFGEITIADFFDKIFLSNSLSFREKLYALRRASGL